ncbi:YceI family protein [Flavobacteriaceae bacterium AU392]|nr:YceI family protein [Flavobacteriaceae bacterium]RKM86150.1 YceI family protein [Flavobacteriaceae bacterium AU392]
MDRIVTLIFILITSFGFSQSEKRVKASQGQVSFFSYTSVENIEAVNNQAQSIIVLDDGGIFVTMLMNAFTFKKALMEEHFNESYIESDIYQKSRLEGKIIDFDPSIVGKQTRIVKGKMSLHGVTKDVEIKVDIDNLNGKYILTGDFEVGVKDYNIKVPPLLAGNIAKIIKVKFRFEYEPYG